VGQCAPLSRPPWPWSGRISFWPGLHIVLSGRLSPGSAFGAHITTRCPYRASERHITAQVIRFLMSGVVDQTSTSFSAVPLYFPSRTGSRISISRKFVPGATNQRSKSIMDSILPGSMCAEPLSSLSNRPWITVPSALYSLSDTPLAAQWPHWRRSRLFATAT